MKIDTKPFWFANAAALTIHSLLILGCSLGKVHFDGHTQKDHNLCIDMVFINAEQKAYFSPPKTSQILKLQSQGPKKAMHTLPLKPLTKHQPPESSKNKPSPPLKAIPALTSSFSNIRNSFPTYAPAPMYPLEARRKKIQGTVLIRLFLTQTGKVQKAIPLPPRTKPVLEEAALTAIRTWKFKPGIQTVEIPIEFKLGI